MLAIESPYEQFFDLDGSPLDNGYIYFGTVNLNPETAPQTVYWDSAGTQPAAQPLRTLNGVIVRNGRASQVYAASDHSITIKNKNGALIAYERNSAEWSVSSAIDTLRADLANATDTAKGGALVGFTQADGSGILPDAVASDLRQKAMEIVSLMDFLTPNQRQAVRNNTVMDLTTPVQAFLDYLESGRPKYGIMRGDVRVTQVTIGGSGVRNQSTYDFYGSTLIGTGSGTSIIQIKTGFKNIFGLSVAGQQSESYECGIHWYTNDTATYYPGFLNLRDPRVSGCLIGMCIGALPTQADPIPAQGTVQADGVATDAPLSESVIDNLVVSDCIIPVYMRQPNGKLTFAQPVLNAANTAWAATAATNEGNLSAFRLIRGEMTVLGGSILNVDSTTGQLCETVAGTLNIVGSIMESKTPIYVGGRSTVRVTNNANWGLNNDSNTFFNVYDDADGELIVSDAFLRRGYGTSSSQPVVKTIDSGGVSSTNGAFIANFDNVEFGDANMTQGATYKPLVTGCRSTYSNCWATTHSSVDPFPRTASVKLDERGNVLVGYVDLAASVITAYGVNGAATSGGWTFATAAATSWGRYATGLPTIEGIAVSNCLRLTSTGAGTSLQATSPLFDVQPQRPYLLKGWAKTGGTGAVIAVRMNYFDFANVASTVDAQIDLYSGVESGFNQGTVWAPFMLYFVPPSDATQASLNLYTENGADLQVLNLEIL